MAKPFAASDTLRQTKGFERLRAKSAQILYSRVSPIVGRLAKI